MNTRTKPWMMCAAACVVVCLGCSACGYFLATKAEQIVREMESYVGKPYPALLAFLARLDMTDVVVLREGSGQTFSSSRDMWVVFADAQDTVTRILVATDAPGFTHGGIVKAVTPAPA